MFEEQVNKVNIQAYRGRPMLFAESFPVGMGGTNQSTTVKTVIEINLIQIIP